MLTKKKWMMTKIAQWHNGIFDSTKKSIMLIDVFYLTIINMGANYHNMCIIYFCPKWLKTDTQW